MESSVITTNSCLKSWKDVSPCALVLVLLLGKDQFSISVFVAFLLNQVKGEGANLFNSSDGNLIFQTMLLSCCCQGIVDLSSAEDESLDTWGALAGRSVFRDDSLEFCALIHFVKGGFALWESEQRLGSHDDQRFTERQGNLTCGKKHF